MLVSTTRERLTEEGEERVRLTESMLIERCEKTSLKINSFFLFYYVWLVISMRFSSDICPGFVFVGIFVDVRG